MSQAKEDLRKIIGPDSLLEDAFKILERLIDLDKTERSNWYDEYQIIDLEDPEEKELLIRLCNGDLVNGPGCVGNQYIYNISKKGKHLYETLAKEIILSL